tara:strand:- start:8899 stop:9543 length:645 start_codon:yes stop_codon:yes gene_type:complete
MSIAYSQTSIYVLKLIQGKYYVGRSNNPTRRLNQHFKGEGSNWTKKYKPIKIIEVIDYCDNFDEDKYTLMYMSIYGMDNVRGGAFCSDELSGADKYILNRMICGATNKCVKCKQHGHYFVDCPENRNKKLKLKKNEDTGNSSDTSDSNLSGTSELSESDEEAIWVCDYCDKEFISEKLTLKHEKTCKKNQKSKKRKISEISVEIEEINLKKNKK